MNLPNKLSMTRMFLVPVFVFFYFANFIPYGKMIALAVFLLAIFTDYVDGKIARKRNMITDLGKLLDTTADKFLVLSGLLVIFVDLTVPPIMSVIVGIAIVGRDLLISGLRAIAGTKGKIIMPDKIGKYKAFVIDIAISLLIVVAFNNQYNLFNAVFANIFNIVSLSLLGIGSLMSIISCIIYFINNKELVKE